MHEHIVTDLRAPEQRRSGDYYPEEAFRVALPHLKELQEAGCSSLVEITPMHIGRDVEVLRRLSKASGLNIVAATGIYGAADGKFVPGHADRETAEQLAERYVDEARQGVGTTGIRPGIIKTGVNGRTPLPALEKKLVRAAALAHKATGLTVASHTGPGLPALAQLDILAEMGVPPSDFIWVHAQNEQDHEMHYQAARSGTWVEFDGLSEKSLDWHLACVRAMAEAGLLNRTLVSHDAGWYRPGESGGGRYRGYTLLFREFLPRLRQSGFSGAEIDQLLVVNPREALART
jgi:phosphotriesterase-related protein